MPNSPYRTHLARPMHCQDREPRFGGVHQREPTTIKEHGLTLSQAEPRQAHHEEPPRSDMVGASRFVVDESLADESHLGER
jgi:hypothetical protein